VLWGHEHRELPVGKAVGKKVWREGDELRFKIQFAPADANPKAEYVYNLYKGGYLNSFSIGFIPDMSEIDFPQEDNKKKGKKQPWRIFNKVELLEISAVPVPANAAAVMAGINKAWDDGVIDGSELAELEKALEVEPEEELEVDPMIAVSNMLNLEKELEMEDPTAEEVVVRALEDLEELTLKNEELELTVSELSTKAKELEKKLEQSELIKEIEVDFDSYLTKVFEKFEASGADKRPHDDHIEKDDDFDEYIENIIGDK